MPENKSVPVRISRENIDWLSQYGKGPNKALNELRRIMQNTDAERDGPAAPKITATAQIDPELGEKIKKRLEKIEGFLGEYSGGQF